MRILLPCLLALAACGTSAPVPPEPLSDCAARDPIDVAGLSIDGSTLDIEYGHGGGCAEHQYSVCWDGSVDDSVPAHTLLTLWHDDGGDGCEAYLSGTYSVDVQSVLDVTGRPVDITVGGEMIRIAAE